MRSLDDYRDWEGTIEDLAALAAKVLPLLGRRDIPPPNVRLIRDYAQRGILSPIDRRGKEGYYGFQHLKELVAARVLVNEGVPLAKIAEQFERDRDIVIITLGLPDAPVPHSAALAGAARHGAARCAGPAQRAGEHSLHAPDAGGRRAAHGPPAHAAPPRRFDD